MGLVAVDRPTKYVGPKSRTTCVVDRCLLWIALGALISEPHRAWNWNSATEGIESHRKIICHFQESESCELWLRISDAWSWLSMAARKAWAPYGGRFKISSSGHRRRASLTAFLLCCMFNLLLQSLPVSVLLQSPLVVLVEFRTNNFLALVSELMLKVLWIQCFNWM